MQNLAAVSDEAGKDVKSRFTHHEWLMLGPQGVSQMQSLKTLDPSIFVSITKRIYVEMELINIAKVRPLSTSSVAPWLQSDQASGDITLPRYLGI